MNDTEANETTEPKQRAARNSKAIGPAEAADKIVAILSTVEGRLESARRKAEAHERTLVQGEITRLMGRVPPSLAPKVPRLLEAMDIPFDGFTVARETIPAEFDDLGTESATAETERPAWLDEEPVRAAAIEVDHAAGTTRRI